MDPLLSFLIDIFDFSNALYLLVSVSQRLMFTSESGGAISYLDETLRRARLHIKRLFDKFIVRSVERLVVISGYCHIYELTSYNVVK